MNSTAAYGGGSGAYGEGEGRKERGKEEDASLLIHGSTPLALKFLLPGTFILTFYSLVFIVICDLFSLTFILITTCTFLKSFVFTYSHLRKCE